MPKFEERVFKYLLPESYLTRIKNSVGTKMFKNFYVKEGKRKFDVLNDGELSCAVFATHVLLSFSLIDKLHFTVVRAVEDIESNNFKKVTLSKLKPGDVLVWAPSAEDHIHLGFYIGNRQAISTSKVKKEVVKHHYTYNSQRKIVAAYRPNWKNNAKS